ncbi:MAG TPA: Virginiamycin B lyase [Acidobacteriota bacterium]|nr:Virginiamycin B lyase [Acidobacteriota bacterium]
MPIESANGAHIHETLAGGTHKGKCAVVGLCRTVGRASTRALSLAALLCAAFLCQAQPTIEFKEYNVGVPFDITAGPDGAMWFTNYKSIGRITTDGSITAFNLPNQNRGANRIAAGPDGALWFTEISPDAIGRITTDGTFTEFPLPNPSGGVLGIAAGPDGALWFTEWSGGKIGRITTTGIITEYPLPKSASTNWIVAGPDGAMWFTEGNRVGGGGYIGRISTSGIITEYLLPPPIRDWAQWGFAGIAVGPDGNLWVTDGHHRVLRVTCAGDFVEYSVPGYPPLVVDPEAITAGPDGALWFVLFWSNAIGRITTEGAITQYPIPTVNSQVSGIATGPDG